MTPTTVADYRTLLLSELRLAEGFRDGKPYLDSRGIATIGYGVNIEEVRGYLLLVLNEIGVIGNADIDEEFRRNQLGLPPETATERRQRVEGILEQFSREIPAATDATLQSGLDTLAQQYGVSEFRVSTEQASNIYYLILSGTTLAGFPIRGKEPALDAVIQNSLNHNTLEYTALMSMFYNSEGTIPRGSRLANAVISGDRQSAWFEIRYRTNPAGRPDRQGIANRRYRESDLFGLYDDIANVSETEAKSVLRMYTTNRNTILDYEGAFNPTDPNAESLRIHDKLVFADRALITIYGSGVAIEEARGRVLVGTEGQDTSTLTGSDQSDLIFGEGGNDTLNGRAGDDVMLGGQGRDTYIVEGNDRIIDTGGIVKDKNGREIAGTFIDRGDGVFQWVQDSTTTGTQNSPFTIHLADGSSVVLDDFQSGDFDIQLRQLPAEEPITRTIVGDLEPIDFDPNTAGVQTQTDDLGNLITDPNVPALNRADTLSGSAGADLIQSGGGSDTVTAGTGADQVRAGTGRDFVYGEGGNDVLEGGAGGDILSGGEGEDRIYAGTKGSDTLTEGNGVRPV